VHGREAYRRNSFLISFMFYKNMLFVFPIFCFGFYSAYSATSMYNEILYQCYNIFFTGIPILYFAIFDFEFEKEEFETNHKLYSIGFKNLHFSKGVFWSWIIYGIWQGAFAFYTSFSILGSPSSNGMIPSSVSVDGQLTYFGIVALVNFKILWSTNNYTGFSYILTLGSIATFLAFFWVISLL
jgi:magnesium-transporting ATPase (P-type)